jgi:hypothetical protein
MALTANVIKQKKDGFEFTISKENFESFCDSIGLYRQEFLDRPRRLTSYLQHSPN